MSYNASYDTLFKIGSMIWNSQQEVNVNAAENYVFVYWKQPTTKTLSAIKFGTGNISGTPTSAFSWEIFNSTIAGAVGSTTGVSGTATPAAYTSVNPTGLSLSLTGGNYYGILIKNVHATPASNFFNMLIPMSTVAQIGWGMKVSRDSGTTYDDNHFGVPPLQLLFNDSSRLGVACMRSSPGNTGNNAIYTTGGARLGYHGVQFQPPGRFWLHRAAFALRLNGTLGSAGALSCLVFRGTTQVASVTPTSPSISTSSARAILADFQAPVLVEPDSPYSVVLANSGGSAAHHWLILGSTMSGYTPTGTSDCDPWGLHSVQALGASLSSWTHTSEQWHAELAFSPALRA